MIFLEVMRFWMQLKRKVSYRSNVLIKTKLADYIDLSRNYYLSSGKQGLPSVDNK